jgi:protein SCO1/2
VGPGWKFLTGREEDITLLRRKLGLYRVAQTEQAEGHGMSLIVGNERTGVWMKRSSFDNPKVLARVMSDRLLNYKGRHVGEAGYVQAASQVAIHPGEDLFRRRCQECHTVGAGDAIGPDLEGVTERRERGWLASYIRNPSAMLAKNDPVARALASQFHPVRMPNLRLSEQDADDLIGFLQQENAKLADAQMPAPPAGHNHRHHGHKH